jgi:ribosome-associated heat shock protein Hsp15
MRLRDVWRDRSQPAGYAVTMAEDTRIDRWLCAVRLVKAWPIATQLCDGGHVRVNGNPAKPSTKVRAGDIVHALLADRERIVEVVRPIETRVGAPVAAMCYVDNSPPPVIREIAPGITSSQGARPRSIRLISPSEIPAAAATRTSVRPAEQASSPRARSDAAGRTGLRAARRGPGQASASPMRSPSGPRM